MNDKEQQLNRKFFQEAGRKGGTSTKKRGVDYYKEIGKKGGNTRWEKEKKDSKKTEN